MALALGCVATVSVRVSWKDLLGWKVGELRILIWIFYKDSFLYVGVMYRSSCAFSFNIVSCIFSDLSSAIAVVDICSFATSR